MEGSDVNFSSQDPTAAIERDLATQQAANRAKIQENWKDTKLPGFFEGHGLSFKLSFPKTSIFQGLKDAAKAIDSFFSQAASTISSFSFKNFLGKISLNFFTASSGSGDHSEEDVRRTTFFNTLDTKGRSYLNATSFNIEDARTVLRDPTQWYTG